MRNILIAAVTILAAAGMIRAEQTCPVRTIPLDSGWRLPPEARIAGAGGRPVLTVTVPPGESAARQVVARRTIWSLTGGIRSNSFMKSGPTAFPVRRRSTTASN